MEALASGTPVIAFAGPALAELIDHGRTGFLVDSMAEMVRALRLVHLLSPTACREAAVERCAESKMTDAYLRMYACSADGRWEDRYAECLNPA